MLHVVLLILKIIGIIIGVLLGLVLLAVAAVLFVPIRYVAKAQYYDKVPVIQAKVTWLFHLLRIKCSFHMEEGLNLKIKVLFFNLKSFGGKEEKYTEEKSTNEKHTKKKKAKKHFKRKEESIFDEEDDENDIFFEKPEETINFNMEEVKAFHSDNEENIEEEWDEKTWHETSFDEISLNETSFDEINSKKTRKNPFLAIWNKIKNIIEKIKDIIQKIKNSIQKFKITQENISQKIKKFSDMAHDKDNQEMISFLWIQVKKLLLILKPKKMKAYIHFGLKDVEATGKAAMYAGILYGFIGKNVTMYPDFEQEIIEGDIYVKGSIRLFPIAMIAFKVYRNKQVRKYIKH